MPVQRLLLAVVCFLGAATHARAEARGPARFAEAARRAESSVLLVEVTDMRGRTRHANGVVVREDGLLVVPSVSVERARGVRVQVGETWVPADVLAADKRVHAALVRLSGPWNLRAVPVADDAALKLDHWVVGVERSAEGEWRSVAGMVSVGTPARARDRSVPVAVVDTPVRPGAALVNLQGRLVGLSLGKLPGRRARAVEVKALRDFLRAAVSARRP